MDRTAELLEAFRITALANNTTELPFLLAKTAVFRHEAIVIFERADNYKAVMRTLMATLREAREARSASIANFLEAKDALAEIDRNDTRRDVWTWLAQTYPDDYATLRGIPVGHSNGAGSMDKTIPTRSDASYEQ